MVPYLGFGPSAHSYDGYNRFWNAQNVNRYIVLIKENQLAVKASETLTMEQKIIELLMLGLRTGCGIDIDGFENLSGVNFYDQFGDAIEKVESRSWGGVVRAWRDGNKNTNGNRGIVQNGNMHENEKQILQNGNMHETEAEKQKDIVNLNKEVVTQERFYLNLDGWGFLDTVTGWFVDSL